MTRPLTKGAVRIWALVLNLVLLVAVVALIDWAWRSVSGGG